MPDLDTDPKMMRKQQDCDTPQAIDHQDGTARSEKGDTDSESGRDRRAAIAGEGPREEQMEAILRQNGGESAGKKHEVPASQDAHPRKGLARSGRSRLED